MGPPGEAFPLANLKDSEMHRNHAELIYRNKEWFIHNCGGGNPVYAHGVTVKQGKERQVLEDHYIQLGQTYFQLIVEGGTIKSSQHPSVLSSVMGGGGVQKNELQLLWEIVDKKREYVEGLRKLLLFKQKLVKVLSDEQLAKVLPEQTCMELLVIEERILAELTEPNISSEKLVKLFTSSDCIFALKWTIFLTKNYYDSLEIIEAKVKDDDVYNELKNVLLTCNLHVMNLKNILEALAKTTKVKLTSVMSQWTRAAHEINDAMDRQAKSRALLTFRKTHTIPTKEVNIVLDKTGHFPVKLPSEAAPRDTEIAVFSTPPLITMYRKANLLNKMKTPIAVLELKNVSLETDLNHPQSFTIAAVKSGKADGKYSCMASSDYEATLWKEMINKLLAKYGNAAGPSGINMADYFTVMTLGVDEKMAQIRQQVDSGDKAGVLKSIQYLKDLHLDPQVATVESWLAAMDEDGGAGGGSRKGRSAARKGGSMRKPKGLPSAPGAGDKLTKKTSRAPSSSKGRGDSGSGNRGSIRGSGDRGSLRGLQASTPGGKAPNSGKLSSKGRSGSKGPVKKRSVPQRM